VISYSLFFAIINSLLDAICIGHDFVNSRKKDSVHDILFKVEGIKDETKIIGVKDKIESKLLDFFRKK
jgi:hypothetical protein